MSTPIQGGSVLQYISTNGGTTFKTLVCLTDNGFSGAKSSSTVDTKCGAFTATGSPDITFTGTGLVDVDPSIEEMSFNDLKALFSSGADFIIVEKNVNNSMFIGGNGVLTNLSDSNTQGSYSTFTYTIKINGTLFINESSL